MFKNNDKCPACQRGVLHSKTITEVFEYKNQKYSVPNYEILECDACEEALVTRKTARATEKVLTDFRRKIDGLLTSDEIKMIRKKLSKTQLEIANLLDVGEKTFARYENGQVTQSKSMDLLLRYMDKVPHLLKEIKKGILDEYKSLKEPPLTYNVHEEEYGEQGEYKFSREKKRRAA